MAGNNAKTREKVPKLRSNQRRAVEAFLTGGSVSVAAVAAGVSERTIYTWRANADFKAAMQAASDEIIGETVQSLSGASRDAVCVLRAVMHKESANDAIKVQAAKAILDSVLKLRELHGLEQRVRELEERSGS